MKTDHTVKINGEWYRAGAEIPALSDAPVKAEAVEQPVVEEPLEEIVEEDTPVEESHEEVKTEKLTKSKITLMNVAGLRELAKQHGVENVDEHTGSELKEILIKKLGL